MTSESSVPVFSGEETNLLASVLDEIIPPCDDGRLRGAGELGLVRSFEEAVPKTPGIGAVVKQGLAAIDELAREQDRQGFAALSGEARRAVLNEVATRQDAFLPSLLFLTYGAYYMDDRVLQGLGLEARPPHPKGHEVEPNDLTLLEDVRRRPKRYREC